MPLGQQRTMLSSPLPFALLESVIKSHVLLESDCLQPLRVDDEQNLADHMERSTTTIHSQSNGCGQWTGQWT